MADKSSASSSEGAFLGVGIEKEDKGGFFVKGKCAISGIFPLACSYPLFNRIYINQGTWNPLESAPRAGFDFFSFPCYVFFHDPIDGFRKRSKKMISLAIVEDDPKDLENLLSLLERFRKEKGEDIELLCYSNGEAFLEAFHRKPCDLVFLDVQLKGMDGMKVASRIREDNKEVAIIFTTQLAGLAIEGYKYAALDYFVKPVRYEDLSFRLSSLLRKAKSEEERIAIPYKGGVKIIPLSELLYIESFGHDMVYHLVDGEFTVRDKNIKKLESLLAKKGFARCNISYIVNFRHCKGIFEGMVQVGEVKLPISRARMKSFTTALLDYLSTNGGIL